MNLLIRLTCYLTLSLTIQAKSNKDEIHIWEPASLRSLYSTEGLTYTIANFGTVPYGHSIYGTVFKASPLDGCSDLDKVNWDKTQGTLIMFVERGNCHFAEKVLNAQKLGAGLVIMGDNSDEDVKKIMPIEKTEDMLRKIQIPSILVSKKDTDNFLGTFNDFSQSDRTITLAINFSLNKKNDKADIKMILQVDDFRSYETVISFNPYYQKFIDSIDLRLHYKIFKNLPFLFDSENCLQRGEDIYCATSSNPGKNFKGIFNETVRQICLQETNYNQYIDYITSVRQSCFLKDGQIGDEFTNCLDIEFGRKLDKDVKDSVTLCMDPKRDRIVQLLEVNNEKIKYNLINYSPLIFINGYFYRGNYQDSRHLTESFCNSFEIPPSGCEKLEAFQQWNDYSSTSLFTFMVVSIIFFLVFVLVTITVFYVYYRRRMASEFVKKTEEKIIEVMSKYYPQGERTEYRGVKEDK